MILPDEGFTDGDVYDIQHSRARSTEHNGGMLFGMASEKEREELAYSLLASLSRSRLATVQRRIAPLLQFDVVGTLPTEVSLQIFSYLSSQCLLKCAVVSRRWQTLADDSALWKELCRARGWEWKQPHRLHNFEPLLNTRPGHTLEDSDDEGMGDEEVDGGASDSQIPTAYDSGSDPTPLEADNVQESLGESSTAPSPSPSKTKAHTRHSAPSVLPSLTSFQKPNYKLLHQTHVRLHNRFLSSAYRLSALQTRGGPTNAHTNTIYCLQLYTYPDTGLQVLFTGSRDRTIREWDLTTGTVTKVINGVHEGSVLSICAHSGYVASAGSDRKVAVWDLVANKLVKVIGDHEDSVLCVRFDDERLVSCSKDRTVRTYSFPSLIPQFILGAHRAAVNAVSISRNLIVSGSGDRSIRLWDAQTGKLLRTLENHHSRGIASIDFKPPFVLSGSSDKHLRILDMTTLQGWSTSPEYDNPPPVVPYPFSNTALDDSRNIVCSSCGTNMRINGEEIQAKVGRCMHGDLVRSVGLGDEYVLSGSYDLSIKVWERKTGALVADLTGGHTGRIFCIGFDCTKIVSCGEDQRICVWDFSHGIDTSFVKL